MYREPTLQEIDFEAERKREEEKRRKEMAIISSILENMDDEDRPGRLN